MSRRVLFNGAVLIRPGAATKIDASQFENFSLGGIGIVGLIGEAESGIPRTVKIFTTAKAVQDEYKAGDLVEAANIAADPSNDPRITAGAQLIICYKVNNSLQSSKTEAATIVYTSKKYGVKANNITVGRTSGVFTITDLDDFGVPITETSPTLGATGKFTIQYTGAGSACTLTISATQFIVATTGGSPEETFTLNFSDYPKLSDLIRYVDALATFTCTSLITNDTSFDPSNLDAISAVDIKTSLTTVFSKNFDFADYINNNSNIVTATLTKGQTALSNLTAGPLSGGTRGTSSNSDWTTGLTALASVRINQLVPLASADASAAQGTFTYASIAAAVTAHCKLLSSTSGRNERQGWIGIQATKTNAIASAALQNSEHICMVAQKIKRLKMATSAIEFLPEWGLAACLAGLRAGANLGLPITWKIISAQGLSSDSSWSEATNSDVEDLQLNGIIVVNDVRNIGFRIGKAITTYTKSDNDAFSEETIVQIWKNVSYELRTFLENQFTGQPGDLVTVDQVPATIASVMEKFKDARAITDSVQNGVRTNAYRNILASLNGDVLNTGVTFTPTPGINYILNTQIISPARISL